MVVFTCQNCGESLQKPKVEKHYNSKCRNKNAHLTCVDCLKDFYGLEYNSHTKCVSEQQRYSAHGTVVKEQKGEMKQAKFVEMIPNLLDSADLTPSQRKLLTVCSKFDNVPKKRQKFHNFVMNAARHIKPSSNDVNSVFDILESALKELKQSSADKEKPDHNKSVNGDDKVIETNGTQGEIAIDELKSKITKKRKDKSNDSLLEDKSIENKDCVEPEEEIKENVNKLSKKQLKKQKKYEKYLTELENETRETDENGQNMEVDENINENHKKNKIKSKKSKIEQSDSNLIEQQNGNESSNTMQAISENNGHKKSKKRKLAEPICEVTEKKTKADTEEEEPVSQGAFDWTDVITRVLESRPDKELSLKRLGKKVIDEYQTVKSDHRTYEELLAKFNKKVKKTKGVKVLKDKAKLIIEEC